METWLAEIFWICKTWITEGSAYAYTYLTYGFSFGFDLMLWSLRRLAAKYLEMGQLITTPDGYCLVFHVGIQRYQFYFPRTRGPSWYSRVLGPDGTDLTGLYQELAGPGRNFYGVPTTPRSLMLGALTFERRDGSQRLVQADEILPCSV